MIEVRLCRGWETIGVPLSYRFLGVVRDLAPGEWRLDAPESALSFGYNATDDRLWMPEDVDTIRITQDGQTRFGGFVRPISEGVGGRELTISAEGSRWSWSGPDLWAALQSRLVFPDPAMADDWAVSHHEITDTAAQVAADFISLNAGASALTERVMDLTVINDDSGAVAERSGRLQPLSDHVSRLCSDAGLTCRLEVDADGEIRVRIAGGSDLSAKIVYNGPTDVVEAKVRHIPAAVTYTIAGGMGEGASRAFRSADTGATGFDRIEQFLDLSAASSAAELAEAADANNRLSVEQWQVTATPTDDASSRWVPGDAFNVGDSVAVNIRGQRYTVPVAAIQFDLSPDRQIIRPILGAAAPNELVGLQRDVTGIASRLDRNVA